MIDIDDCEHFISSQMNYQTGEKYIKELLAEVKRLYRMIDKLRMDFDHDVHIWLHDEGCCDYSCAICDSMESEE